MGLVHRGICATGLLICPHFTYFYFQYSDIQDIAIGTYDYTRNNDTADPIRMCKKHYKAGQIYAFNESFYFDSEIIDGKPSGGGYWSFVCILIFP